MDWRRVKGYDKGKDLVGIVNGKRGEGDRKGEGIGGVIAADYILQTLELYQV